MKAIIVGAGIGGLTAALCLLHRGIDIQVLEKSSELGEVGAGIQLPPNAMKVFNALGIADSLSARAFTPKAVEARLGVDGRKVFSVPIDAKRWGAPYRTIHRADYIDVLQHELRRRAPNALVLNAEVETFAQSETQVSATLSNGEILTGDILIGADGIKSKVRATLFGAEAPRFTGNVAWRAVIPAASLTAEIRETSCAWFGRGKHAVTYPLRGGELVNVVGVVEQNEPLSEGWRERGDPKQAQADFQGWHPYITDILANSAPENLFRWGLYDRETLPNWTQGCVALLGDAAHPMLPFMAQGAAMAVEDAWVLAEELSRMNDVAAALTAYQTRRKPRADMVVAASRKNMKTFHKRTTLGQIATYGPMWLAGSYAPSIIKRRLDKFYAYDVTGKPS